MAPGATDGRPQPSGTERTLVVLTPYVRAGQMHSCSHQGTPTKETSEIRGRKLRVREQRGLGESSRTRD